MSEKICRGLYTELFYAIIPTLLPGNEATVSLCFAVLLSLHLFTLSTLLFLCK